MDTLKNLLDFGKVALKQQGIEDAELDAWYLLEHVTGVTRAAYLADTQRPVRDKDALKYREYIEKRAKHIPLQHLTKEQEFMGLSFYVDEHVLIPRQDTEVLVEEALKRIQDGAEVLDMCTGSGCILVSLSHFCKLKRAVGVDNSLAALQVAEKNACRNKQEQIILLQSDMFEAVSGNFDLIVSNPPYIRTEEIDTLSEEVRLHEPFQALDGKEDGLYFYRLLAEDAKRFLKKEGFLCMEIGCDQGEAVLTLLKEHGYQDGVIIQDLAGLDRVCIGKRV